MPKAIVLPALSSDFESGSLEVWLKCVGDPVAKGEVIAEVSTDKAVVELEAEHAGVLGQILVPAGTADVAVHTPIGILLLDGEGEEALRKFDASQLHASPEPDLQSEPPRPLASGLEASSPTAAGMAGNDGRIRASPSARQLARKLGVDLGAVESSGPRGRIVRGDIVLAAQSQSAGAASGPAALSPRAMDRPYTSIENDRVRKIIAARLTDAKRDIPHFYLEVDYRVDFLLAMRARLNSVADGNYQLSINDLVVKAVANALVDCPDMNRSWNGDTTVQYGDVDVSIAVDSPSGLVTPVVRNAGNRRLSEVSNFCSALIEKARNGTLSPDEYKGGGITVSNLGMFGIRSFSAIINPPQASILAVGAARKVPAIVEGEPGVATVMSCTLSVDHRVIDGASAARFLQVLGSYLEQPERLLRDSV
jgi:pyruvate dehydrogenase E2 component (dihydrolipoyllysine-residue acetyltransferase)